MGNRRPVAARTADAAAPDPRLVALVRLLARHAALQDHEQQLHAAPIDANPDLSSPED